MSLIMGVIMKILVLLMFLVSAQSHAFSDGEGRLQKLAESASPACKQTAAEMQECIIQDQGRIKLILAIPTRDRCGSLKKDFMLCEIQSLQEQLKDSQLRGSLFDEIAYSEAVYILLKRKILRELLESQCQQAENGDA